MEEEISFPIAIAIIIVPTILGLGGVYFYSSTMDSDVLHGGEVNIQPKEEKKEEIPAWLPYKNELYGFALDYPSEVEPENISSWKEDDLVGKRDLFSVTFSYSCKNKKEEPVALNTLEVKVADNTYALPLEEWIRRYESCGYRREGGLDLTKINLENTTVNNKKGIKIRELGVCPPGAGKVKERYYLSRDQRVYTIGLIYEQAGKIKEPCLQKQEEVIQRAADSFRFIDQKERFLNLIFPREAEELTRGETYRIKWESAGVDTVDITIFNVNDRGYQRKIVKDHPYDNFLRWFVPPDEKREKPTEGYVLEINDSKNPLINDISEIFKIIND